jgi:hypothetical protein
VYKAQAVQKLQSDYYLAPNVAKGVVDVLVGIIQAPAPVQQTAYQPPAQQAVYQAPPQQAAYQPPQPQYTPPVSSVPGDKKLRHGFTTFWLWSVLIANILGAVGIFYLLSLGIELSDFQFWTLFGAFGISAYGLYDIIFKWERFGFTMLIFVTIATTVLNPLILFEIGRLECFISFAISNAILYGVLHFRNAFNAKTTWEQLS